jgi:hypothetical protein
VLIGEWKRSKGESRSRLQFSKNSTAPEESNEQYFKRNPTSALEAPVSSCRWDYKRSKNAVDEAKGQPKDGATSTLGKKMAKISAREKLK